MSNYYGNISTKVFGNFTELKRFIRLNSYRISEEYNVKNKNYDKIRHLVEVDDDILVFIIISSQMKELYIAENSSIDKNYIDSIIVPALGLNLNHM